MTKTDETYIFQSANFARKTNNFKNMSNKSDQILNKLFLSELKEMYWSEMILVKILTKIIDNTTDLYLVLFMKLNLEITKNQIIRLEYVYESLNMKFEIKRCKYLKVMFIEIKNYIKHYKKGKFKDEILMLNYQKIAQFEIESYELVYKYANSMGKFVVADFLYKSLSEKIKLDLKLSEMSDSNVNSII